MRDKVWCEPKRFSLRKKPETNENEVKKHSSCMNANAEPKFISVRRKGLNYNRFGNIEL